jgi:hypothetical protein
MAISSAPQGEGQPPAAGALMLIHFPPIGPHKSQSSIGPVYTKEIKRDAQRHQRQRRDVDILIIHRTRQGRLRISRVRTACMASWPFWDFFSVVPSLMFDLVVDPREAMLPFAAALGIWAVDELLVMRRLVVSVHICFAGELSRGSTVRV